MENTYDDFAAEGTVIRIDPSAGTAAEPDSKVKVIISRGPSYISSKNLTFYHYDVVANVGDEWDYRAYNPYIDDGYLYIECNPIFWTSFSFVPTFDGEFAGIGDASLNDKFDKVVPLKIISDNTTVTAGVEKAFTIQVPLSELDTDRPTDLYCKIYIDLNNVRSSFELDFYIEW